MGFFWISTFVMLFFMGHYRSPWPEVWAGSRTSSRESVCCIRRIYSHHTSWWTWPICQVASTSASTPFHWAQVPWAPILLPADWWRTYRRIPHRNAWVTIRFVEKLMCLYECFQGSESLCDLWVMAMLVARPLVDFTDMLFGNDVLIFKGFW